MALNVLQRIHGHSRQSLRGARVLLHEVGRRIKPTRRPGSAEDVARALLGARVVEHGSIAILLDAAGRTIDSNALARWLGDLRDRGTRQVIFVCGNAGGFPESLRDRVPQKLSLSAMTLSHELARVVLAEQLYRGFAILSGGPYPK